MTRAAGWLLALACVAGVADGAEPRVATILIQGVESGRQEVAVDADGAMRAEFSYRDRGWGDDVSARWRVDADGLPLEYAAHGVDRAKASIDETFRRTGGRAQWKNRREAGESTLHDAAFYLPLNPPPEFRAVLARALLAARGHRLHLLPSGEAWLESTDAPTRVGDYVLYYIGGLDFTPQPVWLGRGGDAVLASEWFSAVPPRARMQLAPMLAAQQRLGAERSARLARELAHAPSGGLLIRNARVFDPRDLSVTSGTSVLVRGERIVRVAPDAALADAGAEVVDARGRLLMPGLWDNHQHFGSDSDGALDLANGITSARDMANNVDEFAVRVRRYDDGSELGPRVLKAGIIDGRSEYSVPIDMYADTADEALREVDWYAAHGYAQIKVYNSLKPALVPLVAERAHALGLRFSGHVPAFMSARQFVEAGADEIQHFNFIVLNFLYPQLQETRTLDRHLQVAAHARELTPTQPRVREFVEFLRAHHTVLDPTLGIFEGFFCGDPAAPLPGLAPVLPRLPAQVRRDPQGITASSAFAPPKGEEDAYRAAIPAMLALLKALHDAGVAIVPGTDTTPYMLHHELVLYARAGIAPAEVLRLATLGSAQVMGVDGERGVIAPGRLADMILVDGAPERDIEDLRRIDLVVKGGRWYDPRAIERAFGIEPRSR